MIQSKVDYLRNHAERFGDSVLQHTVSSNNDFPEQAWADTLFMAAYFMLRVGVLSKDEALIEDALNQYYWHIRYLQNEESGLWYHGYNNVDGNHMSSFYWGRANAWAAYTMSQVGKLLPQCYLYPKFVDDEDSYEEVSASCGIAAAMVRNGNPLHLKYINKSIVGIGMHISEDGRVLDVSGGTAVMKDRDGYHNISRDWIQGWGQGLALAFYSGVLSSE